MSGDVTQENYTLECDEEHCRSKRLYGEKYCETHSIENLHIANLIKDHGLDKIFRILYEHFDTA